MQKKCPKCGSSDTSLVSYLQIKAVTCNNCGYDETLELESTPEQRSSQKAKSSFSKYKAGGSRRSQKT